MLELGRNCWRIERADRFALIVDAEDYFRLIKDALLHAQRTVYLIGWDFDTRIGFEPEKTIEGPNQLGAFLRWLDVNRPAVEVFILKWDLGALLALGRGTTPLTVLNWLTSDRIHFRLDGAHPRGAAQHHKIAVIDDVLAFCGGIDMTSDRWDTRNHVDHDARRKRPNGRPRSTATRRALWVRLRECAGSWRQEINCSPRRGLPLTGRMASSRLSQM